MEQNLFLIIICLTFVPLLATAKYTFLTRTYPPFADCTSYFKSPHSSKIIGAEIELLRSAFNFFNWTEGVDFEFLCVSNSSELISTFSTNNDQNQSAVGGIAITSDRLSQGYIFSQPTVTSPLSIVYQKQAKGWFFRRSLTMSGWALIFGTVFSIGGLLYFLENKRIAYINMVYNAFCQFFLVADYPFENFPSKFVHFFLTFLAIILVTIFTAASTNIFEADRSIGASLSLESLNHGTVIYSNQIFQHYAAQFGISPHYIDHIDPLKFSREIDSLDIDYLITDGPYSEYIRRTNCDFKAGSNRIDTIYYGMMFAQDFDKPTRQRISRGILRAIRQKTFHQHAKDYYLQKGISNECPTTDNQSLYVTFYQMRGLWYILLVGIGIGVFSMAVGFLRTMVNKNIRVYNLKGIRARMDGRIQRRTATLFAIYTGVSIQCISFLRRLTEESMQNWLNAVRNSIPEKGTAWSSFRRRGICQEESQEVDPNCSSKRQKNSLLGGGLINSWKSGSNNRISFLKHLSRFGIVDSETNSAAGERKDRRSTAGVSPKNLKKKSSLLTQTMRNFKLDKNLVIKLNTIAERDRGGSAMTSPAFPDSVTTPKNMHTSLNFGSIKSIFEKSYDNSITLRSSATSIFERALGKKGMKRNKQLRETAKALLAKKEAALLAEFEKKKLEISSRKSPRNSVKRTPQSPMNLKARLNPSLPSTGRLRLINIPIISDRESFDVFPKELFERGASNGKEISTLEITKKFSTDKHILSGFGNPGSPVNVRIAGLGTAHFDNEDYDESLHNEFSKEESSTCQKLPYSDFSINSRFRGER